MTFFGSSPFFAAIHIFAHSDKSDAKVSKFHAYEDVSVFFAAMHIFAHSNTLWQGIALKKPFRRIDPAAEIN